MPFAAGGYGLLEIALARSRALDPRLALPRYRDSDAFDDLERRVLDFATALSRSPVVVPGELRDELRRELGDDGFVHLAVLVALENFLGRFNRGVGLEAQGYSEGAACVLPERPDSG